MKKTGMIIASVCLMLGISMSVPASETTDYKDVGISIPKTQELNETTGLLFPYTFGALDDGHHVYGLAFLYEAMPLEDATNILYGDSASEEEMDAFYEAQSTLRILLAADVDFDTVRETYDETLGGMIPADFDGCQEIGSADGFTFYSVPAVTEEAYFSGIGEEYAEEFRNLDSVLAKALENGEYYEPVDLAKAMSGQKIEFTTTDLDGNTVTSEELFSENDITMLNCWGVWCPNCVVEMEDLAKLHTRLQEKGCGIVGLEWEKSKTEETYQQARDSMKEWGTNYPNVLMPEELLEQIDGFPTSIYVDKEGNVLGMPVVGAQPDRYESVLDELLSGMETAQEAETEKETMAVNAVYRVIVMGEDGPLEEVSVQMCDDTTCKFLETDEDGVAEFEFPAGREYEVHVLDVPDGYQEDETVYHTTDESGEVTIQLEKEG